MEYDETPFGVENEKKGASNIKGDKGKEEKKEEEKKDGQGEFDVEKNDILFQMMEKLKSNKKDESKKSEEN